METIESISLLRERLYQARKKEKTVGFVPTMGFLHDGHASLLAKARQENDIVVLSIFVNPTQFGPNEDYETYPRDLVRDEQLASRIGVDYLFAPTVAEMYPSKATVSICSQERVDVLCGKSRPGHFDGVATVVTKLLNIVQPDRAYFGKKDAQQLAIVEGLVADLNLPTLIIGVETHRETDGLAMSSRNVRLNESERMEAAALFQSLQLAAKSLQAGDSITVSIEKAKHFLDDKCSGRLDYFQILQYPTLVPIQKAKGKFIIAVAYFFSKARLIDNIILDF